METIISSSALIIFFVDVLVNLPMNGIYRLPFNKSQIIIFGLITSILLSLIITLKLQLVLPLYVSVPYLILYLSKTLQLMTIINLLK